MSSPTMNGPSASRPAYRTIATTTAAVASRATRGVIGGRRRAGATILPAD